MNGAAPIKGLATGSPQRGLPSTHLLLAIVVVAIWGTNFVVIHVGLERFPPFTFATMRFALASIPLLPFVRRPHVAMSQIALYGLLIGVGQFGLMLYAMAGHMAPGLASVLIQMQALFTVALAMAINRERPSLTNFAAIGLSVAGIALIALKIDGGTDSIGVLLVLGAALAWGAGNLVAKRAGSIDMFALVVWSSLFAVPPLFTAAMVLEGAPAAFDAMTRATTIEWATVFWQAGANALFGYGAWNWLISRHRAVDVAPLGLLVPIFGLSAAAWVLHEPLPVWKLAAAALVIGGLVINLRASPAAKSTEPALPRK